MIASTEISNNEIFTFIVVLVFMLLNRKAVKLCLWTEKTMFDVLLKHVSIIYQCLFSLHESNQIKYLFLLQIYFGPINSTLCFYVKNLQ